jgi:hypothetical protein
MTTGEEFCGTCREVVLRTYREMRAAGRDDRASFRAALHVLVLRHPERGFETCRSEAADWIAEACEA